MLGCHAPADSAFVWQGCFGIFQLIQRVLCKHACQHLLIQEALCKQLLGYKGGRSYTTCSMLGFEACLKIRKSCLAARFVSIPEL